MFALQKTGFGQRIANKTVYGANVRNDQNSRILLEIKVSGIRLYL